MREIKFRGKSIALDKWIYGSLIKELAEGEQIGYLYFIQQEATRERFLVSSGSEDQYTGLKDKNGKEIYGGDIIKTDGGGYGDSICQINYSEHLAGFYLLRNNYNMSFGSLSGLFIEVIGNIYENAELLQNNDTHTHSK